MTIKSLIERIFSNEDLNFLITNRIPRRLFTEFMGWFSQIEQPLVRDISIGLWRYFTDLHLEEANKTQFRSLHDCFIRELKDGMRPIDPHPAVLTSPCDAIIGAYGEIQETELIQAKGFPYTLQDLLGDSALVDRYRNGYYVTLRITSSMYHRFHAPYDGRVQQVNYISGDTWNVNPVALKRVEKLFCKNERAVIPYQMGSGHLITLVLVAAVLVASIRLHCLDVLLHLEYRGPNVIPCDAAYRKGQEMGWFQHGSTIIVFAPRGFRLFDDITQGDVIRMGQALLRLPD